MADLSLISDAAWREAQRRAEVIRPLAGLSNTVARAIWILAAAAALGFGGASRLTH